MTTEAKVNVIIRLSDDVKALLKDMLFTDTFPEEAKGIAFYEDGKAEYLDHVPGILDAAMEFKMNTITSWRWKTVNPDE